MESRPPQPVGPVTEDEKTAVESCTDRLQKIFMWYCSFSESSNANKMPLSKFVLFIKDAGLLVGTQNMPGNKLTITEVELVFSKVIGELNDKRLDIGKEGGASPMKNEKVRKLYEEKGTKRAKMDFKAFYYALTLISTKAYPDVTPNKALIDLADKVCYAA